MIEEAGKTKIAPPSVSMEDRVLQQQILGGLRTLITNTCQRNPLNFTAAIFTSRPQKDHGLQVRQV
jgi:hypothetical protein